MAKSVLLAYTTKGDATSGYAQVIAGVMRQRGFGVDVVDLKKIPKPELTEYDLVIVGTGVRIGMVYRRAKRLLKRKELQDVPHAIFLSSGIAVENRDKSKHKFLAPLIRRYGLSPLQADAFPGIIPEGSQRTDHTDHDLAADWAQRLADRIRGET